MKPLLISLSLLALAGCKREVDYPSNNNEGDFATISLTATRTASNAPFVGQVLAYPMTNGTDVFIGNYAGNPVSLTPNPAAYTFNADGTFTASPKLLMPIGRYSVLYWGVPAYSDTLYAAPAGQAPPITLDNAMSSRQLTLAKARADTAYRPTFDYMYALNSVNFGADTASVHFVRVVGGVKINLTTTDGSPLEAAIKSIAAQIGGVSYALNYYSAAPQGDRVMVQIPLTIAADRKSAANLTALFFPSTANPPFNIVITYTNGVTHIERTNLTNTIEANNRLTLNISITPIRVSPEIGSFTIDNWVESKESLEF